MYACPYCGLPFDGELPLRMAFQHIAACMAARERMVTTKVTPIELEALLVIEARAMESPDYREFYRRD